MLFAHLFALKLFISVNIIAIGRGFSHISFLHATELVVVSSHNYLSAIGERSQELSAKNRENMCIMLKSIAKFSSFLCAMSDVLMLNSHSQSLTLRQFARVAHVPKHKLHIAEKLLWIVQLYGRAALPNSCKYYGDSESVASEHNNRTLKWEKWEKILWMPIFSSVLDYPEPIPMKIMFVQGNALMYIGATYICYFCIHTAHMRIVIVVYNWRFMMTVLSIARVNCIKNCLSRKKEKLFLIIFQR